jgi:hypothetical protein
MKGIAGSLGSIKIQLKPNAKPVKRRNYCLNPKYKEMVRKELDHMLHVGIIVPIEDSKWINYMVMKPNKTREI